MQYFPLLLISLNKQKYWSLTIPPNQQASPDHAAAEQAPHAGISYSLEECNENYILYLWILMWVWRELLAVNDLPQISQVKGFSPTKKKFDIAFYTALPHFIFYHTQCQVRKVKTSRCCQGSGQVSEIE